MKGLKRVAYRIQAMLSLSSVFSALIFLFSMFCCSRRFGRQDEGAPRPPLVRPPPPPPPPRVPPRPLFCCRNTSELAEENSGRKEEPGTCGVGSGGGMNAGSGCCGTIPSGIMDVAAPAAATDDDDDIAAAVCCPRAAFWVGIPAGVEELAVEWGTTDDVWYPEEAEAAVAWNGRYCDCCEKDICVCGTAKDDDAETSFAFASSGPPSGARMDCES